MFLTNWPRPLVLLLILLVSVFIGGLLIDVIEVDAAQYASISLEMWQDGGWLQVMHRGYDYLDKPPLLFWVSALSLGSFGVQSWAYKLPSALVVLFGIYATYRYALLFYDRSIAQRAAWMLSAALGTFLMVNDVRTDSILMGTVAGATWFLAAFVETPKHKYWIGASIMVALAMLAKGPIGCMSVILALGGHILIHRKWSVIFRWQWLVGAFIVAALLFPMLWGLYQQFDLHPEKPAGYSKGHSGVYFYLWEQSFGRLTGENVWDNNPDPFFLYHSFAWIIWPWTVVIIFAWVSRLVSLFKSKFRAIDGEDYSFAGFTLVLLALSQSSYQLPHYVYPIMPWAAVLSARYWERFTEKPVLVGIHYFGIAGFLGLGAYITFWSLGINNSIISLVLLACALVGATIFMYFNGSARLFYLTVLASTSLGLVLHLGIYPKLMQFQSASQAAYYLREKDPKTPIFAYRARGHSLDFYAKRFVPIANTMEEWNSIRPKTDTCWLFTDVSGKDSLSGNTITIDSMMFENTRVSRLTPKFFNPAKRYECLDTFWLLKVLPYENE